MQVTPLPSVPEAPAPMPRAVAWMLALIGVMHFLQWTVVLPADVQVALGSRRADLDSGRWWSVLTYPFVHADASILLLNAYAIGVFGTRLERSWGTGRFVAFAAVAALGAWALHLFIGGAASLLGASAIAIGVLAAHALRWGHEEQQMWGGLRARSRWFAFFVASLVVLFGLRSGAGGGVEFLAHLGGIGAAWLFVRATPVLLVERIRDGVSALPDDPPEDQPPRAVPKTLPRGRGREGIDEVVARANAAPTRQAPTRRRAETKAPAAPPPSIDAILDKILSEGIDRLTAEERRALDDHSRRLRDR